VSNNLDARAGARKTDATLLHFIERFGGKLTNCTVYDANVCTTMSVPDKPWELVCMSGSPFTKSVHTKHRDRKLRLYANDAYTLIEVKGAYKLGVVSINLSNKIDPLLIPAHVLDVGGRQYPTFTRDGGSSSTPLKLVEPSVLSQVLDAAQLGQGESLHFHLDAANAYLRLASLDRIANVVEALIDAIPKHSEGELELRWGRLPTQFHPLVPLISTWALADDDERQELLSRSPRHELANLIEIVEPYMPSINSYLDSLGQNPPLEASTLGTLAECALEAKVLLNRC
jgi:hypothetical protein